MSITIAPTFAESDVLGYRVACYCGEQSIDGTFGAYADATAAWEAAGGRSLPFCEECCGTTHPQAITADLPSVNLSQINAARMFDMLGLNLVESGYCGSIDATDLLGRVLVAVAVCPADEGVPAHVAAAHTDGAPKVIVCGRDAGYTEDRLVRIEAVARWAIENGRTVTWS